MPVLMYPATSWAFSGWKPFAQSRPGHAFSLVYCLSLINQRNPNQGTT